MTQIPITIEQGTNTKSFNRIALIGAMVGVLLSSIVGAAGAQTEPPAYLAAVNGVSTQPTAVTANEIVISDALAYAEAASIIVDVGTFTVAFPEGEFPSQVTVEVAAGSAQTVVSGYGVDPDSAKA